MYLNDIHIIYYVIFIILGAIGGQLAEWIIKRSPNDEKIFSKDLIIAYKKRFKPNYLLIGITIVIYIVFLLLFGISGNLLGNVKLILFIIITPILISMLVIDYKFQIIPNRLNLTLFEIGLIYTFILGCVNVSMALDKILGLLIGGGIFLLITIIGGLIAGKEAMGFGDVKLMCGLGLIFGALGIGCISVLSFLLGAIISVVLLITKVKKKDEYIPFGPFIVVSSFIAMVVPIGIILNILLEIFTLGMY